MAALDAVQKREKSLARAGNRGTIPRFPIPLSVPVMLVKLQTSRNCALFEFAVGEGRHCSF
jgi:hypothetical protein